MNNTLSHGKREKVWESRGVVLFTILTLVVGIGIFLMINIRRNSIEYASGQPVATPRIVCPGDKFSYRVQLETKEPDTVVHITEDWCRTDTAICPRELVIAPIYHNVRRPVTVDTPAERVVPATMPPGEWTLGHCNTATRDGELPSVSCYYVPVTVKACEK